MNSKKVGNRFKQKLSQVRFELRSNWDKSCTWLNRCINLKWPGVDSFTKGCISFRGKSSKLAKQNAEMTVLCAKMTFGYWPNLVNSWDRLLKLVLLRKSHDLTWFWHLCFYRSCLIIGCQWRGIFNVACWRFWLFMTWFA